MIGNDVVDLALAQKQSNWQRLGFLEKIFTPTEQAEIVFSRNQEFLVWLFWSMKEAAYKAHQRLENLPPKFNPWQFECSIHHFTKEKIRGKVGINKVQFYTTTYVKNNCLFTYCQKIQSATLIHQITSVENLKNDLFKNISEGQKLPQENLILKKNENYVPQLLYLENHLKLAFSISHHGKAAAFVFQQ